MTMSGAFADPRPDDVRQALERVLARWRQLPLDQAERHIAEVRALAQHYADLTAASGQVTPLPVLGVAVVTDQLCVTTYDVCAAAGSSGRAAELRRLLAQLR